MYVNVVFVIRCWYSAVSLALVREQRFIRNIYDYDYDLLTCVPLVRRRVVPEDEDVY